MIDVAKVMRAVAYVYDTDSFFGIEVKTKFDLSKEESSAVWEMLNDILPKFAARYDS